MFSSYIRIYLASSNNSGNMIRGHSSWSWYQCMLSVTADIISNLCSNVDLKSLCKSKILHFSPQRCFHFRAVVNALVNRAPKPWLIWGHCTVWAFKNNTPTAASWVKPGQNRKSCGAVQTNISLNNTIYWTLSFKFKIYVSSPATQSPLLVCFLVT